MDAITNGNRKHCVFLGAALTVRRCVALTIFALLNSTGLDADEGMFPISEIERLDLRATGLKLTARQIFSADETCLVDGICRVNTCTGSFVSPHGLIITNHHCAYRAIQSASTSQNDYLADGFQARARGDEIPSKGYTVRITESFRDVSPEVLSAVTSEMPFLQRTKSIERRQKELEQLAEKEHPGLRAEVAEMYLGKSYFLFLYTYIKDVRLVFAPPGSIGNFGGDVDNWEWPRHTGDFSFMRAYVAPDGSSAEYSPANVPYHPKRFLQVAPEGVNENDFVMLLGYPGRTARHKTSHFLDYERKARLPFIVDLYRWEIGVMETAGRDNRAVALKHASRIQSLANVEKRSRGQLKGLQRARIATVRAQQEAALQAFIDADPLRVKRYGSLLAQIGKVYDEMDQQAELELNQANLVVTCRSLALAFTVYDAAHERAKPDLERETAYMDRNFELTVQQLMLSQPDLDISTDRIMLQGMFERLSMFGDPTIPDKTSGINLAIPGVAQEQGSLVGFVENFFSKTKIGDPAFLKQCLTSSPGELDQMPDPAIRLIAAWYPRLMELRALDKRREGRLSQLYGELIDVKREFLATSFVPDANSTLRLTFGRIKGFSPEDAVYKSPITTLKGVVDKTTGKPPFETPQRVLDMFAQKNFGPFVHPKLGQVPVALLYDTDTTGGNSGSPILNADGELVGVNFDRAFEATINDFAWNENYSRSIGVDIRYILWITGQVYGAEHLLQEMAIK